MFVRARRLRILLPLVGLVATASTARAQTTTIVTTPTRLGGTSAFTIASGDTVIVQQGGSLTNDQITNNGTLEFAPTSGTMTNSPVLQQGVGAYIKSGAGTLLLQQPSNTIAGTWEISGGIVSYGASTSGSDMFGQTTVTLSGGFIKPTANNFFLDLAGGLVITNGGGGVDFSGLTGMNYLGSYNPALPSGQPGVTGTGIFTYKGPGSPAVGFQNTLAGFDNSSNRYAGSTILSGGFFAPNSNRGTVQSYFGTSTVTFEGATLSSQMAGNSTGQSNINRTVQLYNDVVLGAGGGLTHGTYGAAQQWLEFMQGVSGSGPLTVTTGNTRLSAINSYSGDTRVGSLGTATLLLNNVDALAGSTLDLATADVGSITFEVAGIQTYNFGGLKGSRNLDNAGNSLAIGANNQSTTYSGALSGSGGISKEGTGTLTLSGANSHTGGTTIAGGTLALGSANALGTSGTLTFNGGTLQFSAANTTDYSSRFSNAASQEYNLDTNGQSVTIASNLTSSGGTLEKIGTGTLTVTGANTYDGGTTLSNGTLALGSAGAIGSSGTITFSGGTLRFSASNTTDSSSRFSNASSQAYNLDTNGQDVTLASNLTSSGGTLEKVGAGTLTLSGNNSYTGTTTVSAGTLLINGNQTAATGGLAVLSGATLGGSGTLGGGMSLAAGSTLSPGNSPGTITSASGTWAGGANYNWQLVDATGTAGTDWDIANFSGTLDITATSGTPFNVNLWTLSSTGPDVNGNASNFNANSQYSWRIATAAGGVTGFAANKFQVNTASANGTAGFANSFGSGQFSVGNVGNDLSVDFSPAVVFNVGTGTSETQTQQGAVANMTTAVSVTKTGAGTVVMNGTNSYAGGTSVNAGTMEVTGSLTNSAVTVNSGGTLAGTGTVNQSVTVAGGGTLAPGSATASTGILSLGGLALDSTATTKLAVNGTTPGTDFDQVSILGSGALGFGGTLDLSTSNIDGATVGTSYQLFNFSVTPTGDFASLTPLGGIYSGITWSGPVGGVWTSTAGTGGTYLTFTQGTGTLAVAVPEPATLALAAIAGLGGMAALRRRMRSPRQLAGTCLTSFCTLDSLPFFSPPRIRS